MLKILLSGEGAKCCDLLRQTGLFAALFPAFSIWLGAESEGFPHTRFGEMLTCVDSRVQQGDKISPPLLLALLFGEYIDEKAENFRAKGLPWQQSIDAATAEFLGELCPFVQIANRVGLALRDIIAQQMRLKQIPGRRPQAFIARKDLGDIIEYCRMTRGDRKDVARQLEWWLAQTAGQEPLPLSERTEETGAPPRKKRRRRRRKPQSDTKNVTK
jgi:poly(A) polymerase